MKFIYTNKQIQYFFMSAHIIFEDSDCEDNIEFESRYALTLGEQSEIHVGCPKTGDGLVDKGFTINELENFSELFGNDCKLVYLHKVLPEDVQSKNEAAVLHIKNGINLLMGEKYADRMFDEQEKVEYDRCYFDNRRQRKLNKIARYNCVFGDKDVEHSEDYKQSSVIGYDSVPYFKDLRLKLKQVFGEKASLPVSDKNINGGLNSEGNHYYNEKSGIGHHGDLERKIVICCSLGKSTLLRFYWREPNSSEKFGDYFEFNIDHGDIYIMSEKATGYDWKKRSLYRLVHGAGSKKYID